MRSVTLSLRENFTFSLFLVAINVNAGADVIVISDTDAINTSDRTQNFDLFENVRNGATDILWLDGGTGYVNDFRNVDLRARWGSAGAVITNDATSSITASLVGRELVVIHTAHFSNQGFDAGGTTKVADYVGSGGTLLYVTQTGGNTAVRNSHTAFLSAIGSTIEWGTGGGGAGDASADVDNGTPYKVVIFSPNRPGWSGSMAL